LQLCPKRLVLEFKQELTYVFSSSNFNFWKRKTREEKSPAGEKCRKFHRNGCKNYNSSLASLARQTGNFC